MIKSIYFDRWAGNFWPPLASLKPYFVAPKGKEWFFDQGNDSVNINLEGIDGTEHLRLGEGRKCTRLRLWGHPEHGVLIIYHKTGATDHYDAFTSKGDMSRLSELVYSLHDTPLPVGLFIPFAKAWLAVKEFMETEGQLPKSIEWVRNSDLPPNTFPDP